MFKIGHYTIETPLLLAPMAGVSDKPFREVCMSQGAGLTVAEMLTSNPALWSKEKNSLRQIKPAVRGPQIVQIAGADPQMMAEAAVAQVALGADVIDINMGCPAKKVLQKAAGSALLKDLHKVESILTAVTAAVTVPVTLKIRTGWCPQSRNGVTVAKLAEQLGIRSLTVHGRTRQCRFLGDAEYDTIAAIKQAVNIPVIANGDIDSPQKARWVKNYTGADGLMIGRAAQGRPWLFREIGHYLHSGDLLAAPSPDDLVAIMLDHIDRIHRHYGEFKGVLFARKHINSYLQTLGAMHPQQSDACRNLWQLISQATSPDQQLTLLGNYHHFLTDDTRELAA